MMNPLTAASGTPCDAGAGRVRSARSSSATDANPGDRGDTSPATAVPLLRVAFAGRAKLQPPEP